MQPNQDNRTTSAPRIYYQPVTNGLIYRDDIAAWCRDNGIPMVYDFSEWTPVEEETLP